MKEFNNFTEYLQSIDGGSSINKSFQMSKSGHLRFHWEDWRESINFVKGNRRIAKEHKNKQMVWVKLFNQKSSEAVRIQLIDLFKETHSALFKTYMIEGKKLVVSLKSDPKDFRPIQDLIDKNKSLFFRTKKINLINGRGLKRSFRLRANISASVLGIYDRDPLKLKIHHITENGFLLKANKDQVYLDNNFLVGNLNKSIRLNLPIGIFDNREETTMHSVLKYFDDDSFSQNCQRLMESFSLTLRDIFIEESENCSEFYYVFVPYNKLFSYGNKRSVKFQMKGFLKIFKDAFLEDLKGAA